MLIKWCENKNKKGNSGHVENVILNVTAIIIKTELQYGIKPNVNFLSPGLL